MDVNGDTGGQGGKGSMKPPRTVPDTPFSSTKEDTTIATRAISDYDSFDGNVDGEKISDEDFGFDNREVPETTFGPPYAGTVLGWPKVHGKYGLRYAWSGLGHPKDTSVEVSDMKHLTYIHRSATVVELESDLSQLRSANREAIADDGTYARTEEDDRIIEKFKLHGRSIQVLKYEGIDHKVGFASKIQTKVDKKLLQALGHPPSLAVEQRVAALELQERDEKVRGKRNDYWRKARDLGQQRLYKDSALESEMEAEIASGIKKDEDFERILAKVKDNIKRRSKNPYHQAKRDAFAADNPNILYKISDTDVSVVLDKNDSVIVFVFSDAFAAVLSHEAQIRATEDFDKWTYLMPQPYPEQTRHGLHWIDHLVKNPHFDYRNADDPHKAKSGVQHFGCRAAIGDSKGKNIVRTRDITMRNVASEHSELQLDKLQCGAFGACTQVVGFFFKAIDSALFDEYVEVCQNTKKLWPTRKEGEFATIRALLTNLMTNEHRDKSDWRFGLAGLTPLGDFEGGDLLCWELGLQIESKSGSVSLLRGRELFHSITPFKGSLRVCVVHAVHEAVKVAAYREMGHAVADDYHDDDRDSCLDAEIFDFPPEEGDEFDERSMHLDSWEEDESDDETNEDDSGEHEESDSRNDGDHRGDQRHSLKRKRRLLIGRGNLQA